MVVWSHRHPFVNLNHYLTYSETKKIIKIYNLVPNLIDLRSCENEDGVQKAINIMKEKPTTESTQIPLKKRSKKKRLVRNPFEVEEEMEYRKKYNE